VNYPIKGDSKMKKPIITAFAFGTLMMPAMAADLRYYKAPPPAPVIMSWTGFYIGANAGWIGSTENTITNTGTDTRAGGFGALLEAGAIPGSVGVSHSGFTGGGQIGYNWQWTPSWVLGLEADFDGLANPSSTVIAAFPGSAIFVPLQTGYARALDDLGTVRARLGYLSSPSLLWYVTGGLAYGQTKLQTGFTCATCAPPANTSILTSNVNTGWTGAAAWSGCLRPHGA
jgi:outer membrane immunogenic protein